MPPTAEAVPNFAEWLALIGITAAVYLALVGCAQMLRRKRSLPFGKSFHLFAVLTALLAAFKVSGWDPEWHDRGLFDLEALVTLAATIPLITILNRALWTRILPDGRRMDAPRLLADTTGLIVFIGMGIMVADVFFGLTLPTSLIAGSGVAAFIIGFAMQDLLGNILAGFALFVSKPFKVGDWLLVDTHHARVLEVTWRSTRLITTDEIVLEVPNSDLVKRPILNFHQPSPRHALRTGIGLHYSVPPARAQAVLRHAASTVPGVCAEPAVDVYVKEFAASSVNYEIKFWIEDHQIISRVTSDVLAHCWYAVRRAGMEIPFPTITLHQPGPRDPAAEARAAASAALRTHAIFSVLAPAHIESLVQHSSVVLFAPAEPLVEQGAAGDSMFLIVQGRVEVRFRREDGATKIVTQLGPGDCLGEMSVLTGEKRSATVIALVEVEVVEITHVAFSILLHQSPEVINRLGELLAKRQQANLQRKPGTTIPPIPESRETVVNRLRAFFELGE